MPAEAAEGSGQSVDLGPLPGLFGSVLRQARLAVLKDFTGRLAADDLSWAQYGVLVVLRLNPGLRPTQVATALGIKRTNFVAVLDGLVRRALVARGPVAADRRGVSLRLSAEGERVLDRLDRLVTAHEATLAARLGEGGRAQLFGLLARLSGPGTETG